MLFDNGFNEVTQCRPWATLRPHDPTRDGSRWRLDANGTVQSIEDTEACRQRKVADRFSATMLGECCAALELRPFDSDFLSGPCVLVRNPATPLQNALVLSLRDAQDRLSITPSG